MIIKDFPRYSWWLLYLIIPLIVWQFNNITTFMIKQINKSDIFSNLNEQKQLKVRMKLLHTVCYFISFFQATAALSILFAKNGFNFDISVLPYFADKSLKIGLVLTTIVYVCEIVHCRKTLKWYLWTHHIVSLIVFFLIYDYDFFFVIGRLYCCIFGALLTLGWTLRAASVYYYLGDKKRVKLRLSLYIVGLCYQAIFAFGQVIVGIAFRSIGYYDTNDSKLIFWIVFEISVLPAQLHTFHDIYCIIKIKIIPANNGTTYEVINRTNANDEEDEDMIAGQVLYIKSGDATTNDGTTATPHQ